MAFSSDAALRRHLGTGFLLLAGVTYLLLVFGSTVRVHGAGLSCPDWPLCFGEVIPQLDFRIFLEWGHRVLASLISFGFLGLGAVALARPELRRAYSGHLALMALVLAAQIVLGGLTVLKLLAYWSVTLHLLFGNAFMVLMIVLALRLRGGLGGSAPSGALQGLSLAAFVSVVVQLALGGLVSSNYAGMACTEWPTCNGGVWFPVWDGIIGLQLFHRFGAYTVFALTAALLWAAWGDSRARRPAALLFGLVCGQVVVGISNVLLVMPAELAVLHAALAHLIMGVAAWSLTGVWARRAPTTVAQALPEGQPA